MSPGCGESAKGGPIFGRRLQDQRSQLSPKLPEIGRFSIDHSIKPTRVSLGRFHAHALPRPSVFSSDSKRHLLARNGPRCTGISNNDPRQSQKQSYMRKRPARLPFLKKY
ncbi:hypothetical protein OS493_010865 [Desmophyllum pertusum]|uniref:Uncharacterized protein n=1 Tax=Desmophyllum pertusum TaxID=174260 RepID=A0A9W9ZHJ2_9CNID|nr:hypothetical protein OS493_010865 [Desmophyllum pertusum]